MFELRHCHNCSVDAHAKIADASYKVYINYPEADACYNVYILLSNPEADACYKLNILKTLQLTLIQSIC